jgi:multidrug efflux system membrane fusion protein
MKRLKYILAGFLLVAGVAGLGSVFYKQGNIGHADTTQSAAGPQSMPVVVTVAHSEAVQIWKQFSGNVEAVDSAEIRPQVSGRITELQFEAGQPVKKGDVLIVIDPRPYKAVLDQTKAALNAAKGQAVLAEKEYKRAKKLISTEAISQSSFDERIFNRETAVATVKGAKALVEIAELDLDYAYIKAPISGKISRAEITVGNLVQAGSSAPLLTSIVADEQVYVDFEVDERTYLNLIKSNHDISAPKTPVRLQVLEGGIEYQGVVHSFDNRIDSSSGTIRARAIFENPDKLLLPGISVSILMSDTDTAKKLLISELAIGTDQNRKFVYIINDKGLSEYREVTLGASVDGFRVILSGLNDGDQVITKGIAHIRPNMPVTPKQTDIVAAQTTTPPEASIEPSADNIIEKE